MSGCGVTYMLSLCSALDIIATLETHFCLPLAAVVDVAIFTEGAFWCLAVVTSWLNWLTRKRGWTVVPEIFRVCQDLG